MTPMALSLALVPRDGFFFKDGRGWYTSDTNRAGGLAWPFPSTVRGALTTACGHLEQARDNKRLTQAEWLGLKGQVSLSGLLPLRRDRLEETWEVRHRMWPVPRDTFHRAEGVVRLEPRPETPGIGCLGGGDGEEATAIERLWRAYPEASGGAGDKPAEAPAWWDEVRFTNWLARSKVGSGTASGENMPGKKDYLRMESRPDVKVVIEPGKLTARDGGLYSYEVLESLTPTHQWALGVRAALPTPVEGITRGTVTLGGKGRITFVHSTSADVWSVPETLLTSFRQQPRGLRLVLVTPGHFEGGWILPGFTPQGGSFVGQLPHVEGDLILRSAIVPRNVAVSGWDLARQTPKPTLRLVSPGSVYFLSKMSGASFTEQEARKLWLTSLGQDQADGFGVVVPGVWNPGPG